MSAFGRYELELQCDQSTPEPCDKKQTFVDGTRFQALATAKYDGWMISRAGRTFCPQHAEERRASWR